MDIGNQAQSAIEGIISSGGGWIFLNDGTCSGWFNVKGVYGWRGATARTPVTASPGSVCAIATLVNKGTYSYIETVITNNGWKALARAQYPFAVRKTPATPRLSFKNALRDALYNARGIRSAVVPSNSLGFTLQPPGLPRYQDSQTCQAFQIVPGGYKRACPDGYNLSFSSNRCGCNA